MSQLYSAFRTNVLARYTTGAQGVAREEAAIQAVADYVKSQIVREVDADLPLRQSYLNSYREAKVRLAGYTLTSNFATVLSAVKTRITVDAARDGIAETGGFNEKMVQQGMDDLNGAATLFSAHLVDAVIEIQRKVHCYQSPFESTYKKGDGGVVIDGYVSKITLPAAFELNAVRYGTRHASLAANTAYAADAKVLSNGRVYICTTPGTSANPLGAGLTVTDGTEQLSGTAGFKLYSATDYQVASAVSWASRYSLLQNGACVTPLFAINPQGTELWVYPALDDDHEIRLDYEALKLSFADGDSVPFDQQCEMAAAHYVRAMLLTHIAENTRDAAVSMSLWQNGLKHLYLDCIARQSGRP